MGTGMNQKQKSVLVSGLVISCILITALFCGCIEPEKETDDVTNNPLQNTAQDKDIKPTPSIPEPANITSEPANITSIKVVKFEPAHPCQSCANLGNFAKLKILIIQR